jgi:hypothetical protein
MLAFPPLPVPARDAAEAKHALLFSICTLVTRPAEYAEMTATFLAGGFTPDVAEYLYLDNSSGNAWDAYSGFAQMFSQVRGRYVIYCHQDVRLLEDGATQLLARLAELDRLDPHWALAGNAGGLRNGDCAIRISDPYGENTRHGELPARAVALDENFMVLRRASPVGISADIGGFHMYGPDLGLHAKLAGRGVWVIDFHLRHLSGGKVDLSFCDVQDRFQRKYAALFSRRWHFRTTATWVILPLGWRDRWASWRQMRKRRAKARERYK